MAQKAEHLQKAQHNEDFSDCVATLDGPASFDDWEAVAIFYAALQLVDAKLADHSIHPDNHAERFSAVHDQFRMIWAEYSALYNLAREARYKPEKDITASDVAKARNRWFPNIKAMCSS